MRSFPVPRRRVCTPSIDDKQTSCTVRPSNIDGSSHLKESSMLGSRGAFEAFMKSQIEGRSFEAGLTSFHTDARRLRPQPVFITLPYEDDLSPERFAIGCFEELSGAVSVPFIPNVKHVGGTMKRRGEQESWTRVQRQGGCSNAGSESRTDSNQALLQVTTRDGPEIAERWTKSKRPNER